MMGPLRRFTMDGFRALQEHRAEARLQERRQHFAQPGPAGGARETVPAGARLSLAMRAPTLAEHVALSGMD